MSTLGRSSVWKPEQINQGFKGPYRERAISSDAILAGKRDRFRAGERLGKLSVDCIERAASDRSSISVIEFVMAAL